MKYKIGIFGSAAGDYKQAVDKATQLGQALQAYADKVVIITGACSGVPYIVASVAAAGGVEVWGYSPAVNEERQRLLHPEDDIAIYSRIIYIPEDFEFRDNVNVCHKYRNVTSTSNCDAGIIISGRWGTLNEFTNLTDMSKTVGVLTGTGGAADILPELTQKLPKKGSAPILFESDPVQMAEKLLTSLSEATVTA